MSGGRARRCHRGRAGLSPASIAAVALLLAAARAAAQPSPGPSYDEELSVEVINVEVYVTDRKGQPVSGLTREDFRLREDGEPLDIDYFSEIGPQRAPLPAPAPAVPATGGPAAARDPANLVIYLDDANMSPAGRRRVLAGLREALATGTDGAERLMLVVFDGGLQVVHPLTADRAAVLAALEAMPDRVTGGIFRGRERQDVVRAVQAVFDKYDALPVCPDACDCGWQEMEAIVREHAAAAAAYVDAAADGLSLLSSALAGVAGRKAVLYVADGIEQRPGMDLFHWLAELCPAHQRELSANYLANDQSSLLGRLTAHANANGVTFYPLDSLGLQTTTDISQVSHAFTASILVQQIATANRQSPLFQLASDTGGRATLGTLSVATALAAIGSDAGHHYSLGFTSRHRGDGKLHRLAVEVVGRRGLQVRHRTHYRDKEVAVRLAERVWGTLLLGTGANSLGAEVAVGAAERTATGCCTVPVTIRLPLARIALGPSGLGRLYVVLAAREAAGKGTSLRAREIVVEGAPAEEPAAWRTLVVTVELAPGPHELAVGLLDLQGGGEALLRAAVEVLAPQGGAAGAP